jgi:hypothetical protein
LPFACSPKSDKQIQVEKTFTSNEISADELTLRAKFAEFWLGDAEHYLFETESDDLITFAECGPILSVRLPFSIEDKIGLLIFA